MTATQSSTERIRVRLPESEAEGAPRPLLKTRTTSSTLVTTTEMITAETTSQTRTTSSARKFDERICNEVGKEFESPTQIRRATAAECEKPSISDDIAETANTLGETHESQRKMRSSKSHRAQTQPPDLERVDWWTLCTTMERGEPDGQHGDMSRQPWYDAEVDTMLDNIDVDFDQSQTTSTKHKYTNCTNNIKSALKGHAAAIEYYRGAIYQSLLNPDGTESKVWIELLEKAKLGQNYFWEAAISIPRSQWSAENLGHIQYERSHEFRADGAVTIRQLLVLPFRTKSRTSRAEGRKIYQRLLDDRT